MWIFCGSNWLHIKHAIFWPLHLSSCLSWSDQCTSSAKASVTFFRLVMVCGLGKFHQIHRVLWKISWWIISRGDELPCRSSRTCHQGMLMQRKSWLKSPPTLCFHLPRSKGIFHPLILGSCLTLLQTEKKNKSGKASFPASRGPLEMKPCWIFAWL